jgi:metallo-beta-lactamase family protein
MNSHTVVPLGDTDDIGGSCYYIDLGGRTILVDCGVSFRNSTQYPDFDLLGPGEIDAVFLTHAHIEQVGGLLRLEQTDAFATNAPIICTQPTAALLHVILQELVKEASLKVDPGTEPQFTSALLGRVLNRLEGVHFGKGEHSGIQYQFGNAGHILGSSWFSFNTEGHRTVFTGHLGKKGLLLDEFAELPTADSLIFETMYYPPDLNQSVDEARQLILDALEEATHQGTPILIPVDSAGMAQELLRLFQQQAVTEGLDNLEIFLDETIYNITQVHTNYLSDSYYSDEFLESVSDADITDFVPVGSRPISTQTQRETLFDDADEYDDTDAKIIITSGATFERGPAQFHLYQFADRLNEATIILPDYQPKDSVGGRLAQMEGENVEVTIRPMMSADFADSTQRQGVGFFEKTVKIPQSWITYLPSLGRYPRMGSVSNIIADVNPETVYLSHIPSEARKPLEETLATQFGASFITASRGVPFPKDR